VKSLSATGMNEYIDFEIAHEGWDIYELEEGVKLRVRAILKGVIKRGGTEYGFAQEVVVGVAGIPAELKGLPAQTELSSDQLRKMMEKEDIKFTPKGESTWNVYRLSDGNTLSLKLVVSQIDKTSAFNPEGEPIYIVQSQPVVKFKTSK